MKRMIEANDLSKFLFVSYPFGVVEDGDREVLEHVEQIPALQPLFNQLQKNAREGKLTPLIIHNETNDQTYIGIIDEDQTIRVYSNDGYSAGILYAEMWDISSTGTNYQFSISLRINEYASTRNTKTLFGNQSIIGSGNIDLYRHQLKLTGNEYTCHFEYISSSNLKCDSIQDLQTITKANSTWNQTVVAFPYNQSLGDGVKHAGVLSYTGSRYVLAANNITDIITIVEDKVTTI